MASADAPTFGARLRALPTGPGVYLMRAADSEILYVGKAANLRSRVSSYFGKPAGLPPKIRRMVRRIADFEFIVTESEQEALILESNLIKERPAAVQRAPQGRQVVSLHQDRRQRGFSACLSNAAREGRRRAVLRSVRQRLQRPQDARRSQKTVPLPLLHEDDNGQRRQGVSGLLHSPLRRALHRRGGQGRLSRDHRPGRHVP